MLIGMSNLLEPIVQAVVLLWVPLLLELELLSQQKILPPIPSEVILPSAGLAAASGTVGL